MVIYQNFALKCVGDIKRDRIDQVSMDAADIPLTNAVLQVNTMQPYQLSVMRAKNVISASLPLLSNTVVGIFCQTFLFCGEDVVPHTVRRTKTVDRVFQYRTETEAERATNSRGNQSRSIQDDLEQEERDRDVNTRKQKLVANPHITFNILLQSQHSEPNPHAEIVNKNRTDSKGNSREYAWIRLYTIHIPIYYTIPNPGRDGPQYDDDSKDVDSEDSDVGEEGILVRDIPPGAKLCVCLYGVRPDGTRLLGYATCAMADERGLWRQGSHKLRLWGLTSYDKKDHSKSGIFPYSGDWTHIQRGVCCSNYADAEAVELEVKFPYYDAPIFTQVGVELGIVEAPVLQSKKGTKSTRSESAMSMAARIKSAAKLPKALIERTHFLIGRSSMYKMTQEDKELIWQTRYSLFQYRHALPFLLKGCDWNDADVRAEVYDMLSQWKLSNEDQALALLDAQYGDPVVRRYAVYCLRHKDNSVTDAKLQLILLQLVQCLKFETHNFNALAVFLLERALASPLQVGHHLFWALKSELINPMYYERIALIIEVYLTYCTPACAYLSIQNKAVKQLERVAELVRTWKNKDKMPDDVVKRMYHQELTKLNKFFFQPVAKKYRRNQKMLASNKNAFKNRYNFRYTLPLNPRLQANTLVVEKCKFMSSAKKPLWLVFTNSCQLGDAIQVIYKAGDDLRQDMLTLQLLVIMDQMWLDVGMDMRLIPYKCMATGVSQDGDGIGMIEVVLQSDTTSGIQMKYGGGAIGALKMNPLSIYIREHNKDAVSYEGAVDNFIRSCAGYCVASYVLGIGDRHNGNIMLKEDGHLFHIDFGHFLGNFKRAMGFNRERAAFVFTPEMAYVFGGKNYKKSSAFKQFKELCCNAFNTIRRHATFLEMLFVLMVSAGMPELLKTSDVNYLTDMLLLDATDKTASKIFEKEINKSVSTTYRRLDNYLHIVKHKN